jgi:acetolactate synthase-1/2/3 large subunit
MKIRVTDYIANFLTENGITDIYTVTGGGAMHLAAISVTSGLGGTNAITGVMGGWVDSIPMLVISG